MGNSKKKLSNYIDKLNAEKKPKEHKNPNESIEYMIVTQKVSPYRTDKILNKIMLKC